MTLDPPFSSPVSTHYAGLGWLVSCLVHGALAIGAVLFIQRIHLATEPAAFTWDVAMISSMSASPSPTQNNAAASETPLPSKMPTTNPVVEPSPGTPAASLPRESSQASSLAAPPSVQQQGPSQEHIQGLTPPPPPASTELSNALQQAFETLEQKPETTPALRSPIQDPASELRPSEPSAAPDTASGASAAVPDSPSGQSKPSKLDYGWVAETMSQWIRDLDKRYPVLLRTEGVQGRVTLVAILHEDGRLTDVRVVKSSGNQMLDEVAAEDVKRGPLVKLSRPLERNPIPVKFSVVYDLK